MFLFEITINVTLTMTYNFQSFAISRPAIYAGPRNHTASSLGQNLTVASICISSLTSENGQKRSAIFSSRDGSQPKKLRMLGPTPVISNATPGPSRTPSRPPSMIPFKRKKSPIVNNITIEISSEDSDDEVRAQLIKVSPHIPSFHASENPEHAFPGLNREENSQISLTPTTKSRTASICMTQIG